MKKRDKRGQVTIFIIIAILVVAVAVLIYFLFPKLRTGVSTETPSPSQYIDTCMRDKIKNTIESISLHGGTFSPNKSTSYNYQGEQVKYLCYVNSYYTPCVVQEPLLLNAIKNEIKNEIDRDVQFCFDSLVESYEIDGYDTILKYPETESVVEILSDRVLVTFKNEFTTAKGETQTYKSFQVDIDSKLYEIYGLVMSIMSWEQSYGSAPVSIYMNYYPNILITTELDLDGTRVYSIEELTTEDKFNFAIRSLVLPPGY